MRERDSHNLRRGPRNKSYPPGTIQYALQHAVDESAAIPPHPSIYHYETADSSLRLELFTELHTNKFKNGIFAETTIDTCPAETLKLLLDSPSLTEQERATVLEFKEEFEEGIGKENIDSYILALDRFLKMLRRDAVERNIISEVPATEITVRSEGELPTIMRIDDFGEVTFVGIGDTTIAKAFEGYMEDWRTRNGVPPCRRDSIDSPTTLQRGKSIEALQRMGINVGGLSSVTVTPDVTIGNGHGNGEAQTGVGDMVTDMKDRPNRKDANRGGEFLHLEPLGQYDEAFVDRESDSDYKA